MVRCPVCDDIFKKSGLQRHITAIHPEYRAKHPIVHDVPDESSDFVLEDEISRVNPIDAALAEPVYEARRYRKVKSESNPPEPSWKKALVEKVKDLLFERAEDEPSEPKQIMVEDTKTTTVEAEPRDVESFLDMFYRLPALILVLGGFYFAWTRWDTIQAWGNHPIVEFYGYLLMTITAPISLIILGITAMAIYLVGTVIYRFMWRIMFPDLQIKSYKDVPVMGKSIDGKWTQIETKKIFMPPTRRGRIYLMLGRGRWDRMYRKRTGKPRPDIVTIYYRDFSKTKNPFANPFKVLASCEKGYLNDPAGTRLQRDGLFRRTLIATHMRRDTEDDMTVWWFENEPYAHKEFKSEPYVKMHSSLINAGLGKVSQACGMDSTIQKDQMRNSVSYLPKQLLEEDAQMTRLKEAIMRK